MRIALCFRRNDNIHRLVWITESKNGIYLGIQGAKQEIHISYHQDGTRHAKLGTDYHNRFSDVQIASHKGVRQLHHVSLPITKEWFTTGTAYSGENKTESLFLLDEALFRDRDTLALDVWLLDRASEQELFRTVGRLIKFDPAFHIITEIVASLDSFPEQKIALTLRSARVRGVDLTDAPIKSI
jgi:hypothetical protein